MFDIMFQMFATFSEVKAVECFASRYKSSTSTQQLHVYDKGDGRPKQYLLAATVTMCSLITVTLATDN